MKRPRRSRAAPLRAATVRKKTPRPKASA